MAQDTYYGGGGIAELYGISLPNSDVTASFANRSVKSCMLGESSHTPIHKKSKDVCACRTCYARLITSLSGVGEMEYNHSE